MAATEPDAGPLAITSESAEAAAAEADEGASAASSPAVLDTTPVRAAAVPDASTAAAQLAAAKTAMIRGFVIAP